MSHRSVWLQSVLFLTLLLGVAWPLHAATYYVSPFGSDSAPGTQSQPFRTLARGVAALASGDTLYLHSGLYTEGIDTNTQAVRGGHSWDSATTIAAMPGATVVLQPGDGRSAVLNLWTASSAYLVVREIILDGTGVRGVVSIGMDVHHIRVERSEIRASEGCGGGYRTVGNFNTGNAVNVEIYGHHLEFRHAKIHGSWCGYGVYDNGHSNLYDGNEIYNNAGYGMHFFNGYTFSGSNNHTVINNRIHGNGYKRGMGGLTLNHGTGYHVVNNLIYNNYLGIEVDRDASGLVAHNTIYNNQIKGLELSGRAGQVTVRNNILYQNAGGNNLDNQRGSDVSHTLTTDPRFVNASGGDFRLQAGSPAIDAGTVVPGVSTDITGGVRPHGTSPDIGAYEAGASASPSPAPPTSVPAPRNLRAVSR